MTGTAISVDRARELLAQVEANITELVRMFEQETGLHVVALNPIQENSIGEGAFVAHVAIDVSL